MRVAIIGAGITGMTVAYDLKKSGHDVVMFEGSQNVGGLASGFKEPHWSWSVENYYHHWFTSDTAMFQLLEELGLRKQLCIMKPRSVVYSNGAFYPLDSIPAILKFPGFTLLDIIRFGAVTAYLKYLSRWQNLEKYTAHMWLSKMYGTKLYQRIWEPMLEGKFGPYAKKVTMAWMWARLKARTNSLATFEGGFQRFVDAFAEILTSHQVKIHLQTAISRVRSKNDKVIISYQGKKEVFDACLITTSPAIFKQIVPELSSTIQKRWEEATSLGALVLVVSLTKPLSPQGYYWYNLPKNAGFPFLALVEHTNFINAASVGGDHIIYCGDYLASNDPRFSLSKEALIERYESAFKKINPAFEKKWIKKTWLWKTSYAQPVPFPNHSQKIAPVKTSIPGLYYASMSHIYPWDRGTNYAVKLGHEVATLIDRDWR